jgi:DNA-binding transcriptional MerR regulator
VTYTVEELAAATGLKLSTIRYYQHKRILDPPERQGRVGVYHDAHLERLHLIAELQDKGLSLDAIRTAVGRLEHGEDSLADWLGLSEQLREPWSEDQPRLMTAGELQTLLADHEPGLISRLEKTGLIARQGDTLPVTWLVESPGLLEIALRLHDAGIDLSSAAEAREILRRRFRRAAAELLELWVGRVGTGLGRTASPADVATAYEALRPLGLEAVRLVFAQEMERALRSFVEGSSPARTPARSGRTGRTKR